MAKRKITLIRFTDEDIDGGLEEHFTFNIEKYPNATKNAEHVIEIDISYNMDILYDAINRLSGGELNNVLEQIFEKAYWSRRK